MRYQWILAWLFLASSIQAAQNVTTQHYDNQRTGANTNETILTPANVTSATFGKLLTRSLDARVNGQVLYMPNMTIAGGVHNVIYCTTSTNSTGGASSLYAFDADDPAQSAPLFRIQLPTSAQWTTGAPVIDPSTNTIFVLTKSTNDSGPSTLRAFDIATGAPRPGGSVDIAGSVPGTGDGSSGGVLAFNTAQHNCRAALLFANGSAYCGFAHNTDQGNYHGWVFKYTYNGSAFVQDNIFCTTPQGGLGGIWQTGKGLMSDTAGNIYFTTGNGVFNQTTSPPSYSMCYMKLSPTLQVLDWFAPSNQLNFSNADQDVGNTGVLMIPGTNRIVSGGTKYARFHLLDSTNMGHTGWTPSATASTPDTCLQTVSTSVSSGQRQNAVAWNGGANGTFVYLWGAGQRPTAYAYTAPGSLAVSSTNANYTANGGSLVVTSNGTSSGILWALENNESASNNVFHAFSATNLATEYWNSSQAANSRDSFGGTVGKWQFPVVVNGKAYIATGANQIVVYGLLTAPTTTSVAAVLPITYKSSAQNVNLSATVTPVSGSINEGTVTFQLKKGTTNIGTAVTSPTLVNGSTGTVTYSVPAGSTTGGYIIAASYNGTVNYSSSTDSSKQLTINPAPLTVIADSATRQYGTANPTFTGSISGVETGDGITANFGSSATPASAVNTYPIVPTLSDPNGKLSNYSVTSTNGTLTVTKAPLSVAADSTSRTYGAANSTFTGTLSGVLNGDNITAVFSTSATPGSAIGDYAIVPQFIDPDSKLGNYNASITNGTLSIGKADLSVTPADKSRPIGTPNPTLTGVIAGIQNNDNVTATYSTTAVDNSPLGTYPITAALNDPDSKLGNYNVTLNTGTLTVTKAAITVVVDDATRPYGTVNPAFTGTLSGVIDGDNIQATFDSAAVPGSPVGTYPIVPHFIDPDSKLASYTVNVTNGTLTITPVALSVTPADATRVAGAPNPTFTGALVGILNDDTITVTYSTSAVQDSAAGTYDITATLNDPDNRLGNYTVTLNKGTLTVTPAIPPIITSALTASATKDTAFTYTITVEGSAPLTLAAANLPAGLSLVGADITGTPSVAGVFNVTLSATNFGGSDSKILKLTVIRSGNNGAPVITLGTASPNPATTGTPILFTAQATDPDGDGLDYTWDFGDGSTGAGASVSKTYTAPGVYAATLTVSDGQSSTAQPLNVLVQDQPAIGMFTVEKATLAFNFKKTGKDSLNLSGQIPVEVGFVSAAKSVRVLIGLLDVQAVLDSKGHSANKTFTLRTKKGATSAKFTFALRNQDLFSKLQGLGFSKTQNNPSLVMPVIITLGVNSYLAQPVINYTARSSKAGPVSGKGKK